MCVCGVYLQIGARSRCCMVTTRGTTVDGTSTCHIITSDTFIHKTVVGSYFVLVIYTIPGASNITISIPILSWYRFCCLFIVDHNLSLLPLSSVLDALGDAVKSSLDSSADVANSIADGLSSAAGR